jgi:hypothetical protein
MTKKKIADRIFVVRFDSQFALASTFLRFQEHYESPRFRNRVFSLEAFMDWYADNNGGEFSYYEDWSGFNVPSTTFEPFYQGKFDPLLRKEQRLLRLFRKERAPFYVIGIADKAVLKHELAHALFFTRPGYKKAVLAAMRRYNTSAIRKQLVRLGYHRAVVIDEVQAYLVAPEDTAVKSPRALKPLARQLRAIFRAHAKGLNLA